MTLSPSFTYSLTIFPKPWAPMFTYVFALISPEPVTTLEISSRVTLEVVIVMTLLWLLRTLTAMRAASTTTTATAMMIFFALLPFLRSGAP